MRRPRVPALALLLITGGCASLQPVSDPASYIPEMRPRVVYATHKNGSVLAIAQPRVSGDSLLGTWEGSSRLVAVSLANVRHVEAIQRDKKRTTMMIAGVTALTATLTYMLVKGAGGRGTSCDTSYHPEYCPEP